MAATNGRSSEMVGGIPLELINPNYRPAFDPHTLEIVKAEAELLGLNYTFLNHIEGYKGPYPVALLIGRPVTQSEFQI